MCENNEPLCKVDSRVGKTFAGRSCPQCCEFKSWHRQFAECLSPLVNPLLSFQIKPKSIKNKKKTKGKENVNPISPHSVRFVTVLWRQCLQWRAQTDRRRVTHCGWALIELMSGSWVMFILLIFYFSPTNQPAEGLQVEIRACAVPWPNESPLFEVNAFCALSLFPIK